MSAAAPRLSPVRHGGRRRCCSSLGAAHPRVLLPSDGFRARGFRIALSFATLLAVGLAIVSTRPRVCLSNDNGVASQTLSTWRKRPASRSERGPPFSAWPLRSALRVLRRQRCVHGPSCLRSSNRRHAEAEQAGGDAEERGLEGTGLEGRSWVGDDPEVGRTWVGLRSELGRNWVGIRSELGRN